MLNVLRKPIKQSRFSIGFLIMVVACTCAVMFWRSTVVYPTGVFDLYPLYYGAKAWRATGNAYDLSTIVPSSHLTQPVYRIGNSYPLPAILLILPLSFLSPQNAAIFWVGILVAGLLLVLRLDSLSLWLIAYFPILNGINLEQYTVFVLVFQLLALWAWREKHPWLLAICCTLVLTKPTQGLLFVLVLALLARNWRQQIVVTTIIWGGTIVIDHNWLREWLPTLSQYQAISHHPIYWGLALFAIPLFFIRNFVGAALMFQFLFIPYPIPASYITSAIPLGVTEGRYILWLIPISFLLPLTAPFIGFGWATAFIIFLPVLIIAMLHYRTTRRTPALPTLTPANNTAAV